MKLRRVLFSLVALVMVFLLFACGETTKDVKITFDSNGGSAVAEIVAAPGADITKPADPTKEGLTFGGWYADIDLLEKYEFPAKMPSENVELYAKWLVTLTFDSQGGPQVDAVVGEGGKTFKMPADPVRDGYVFVGWFTDKAYTKQLTYVMPKTNTTAYAKWQVLETGSAVTVPMNFVDNDGCFLVEGNKFTATAGKGEWSYVAAVIPCAISKNNTVVVELIGTKGTNITLKVEGGNAEGATETTVEMTGELQKVIWTDEAKKFSSVGGAKFLFFLNGGTAGAGATPEYVEIKSIKLYRTVDAEATQKAAIYFVMNGADELPEIYDVPGTTVTKPQDPVREGFEFAGWFADAEFTTPYEFTTIPETGAMVFVKWNRSKEIKADVSILGEPVIDNAAAYEVSYTYGMLTFKKTASGEEWSWFGLPFPEGAKLGGYDHLLVTLMGPKDEQVLLKINDSVEKWVTCTGDQQILDLEFSHNFDMTKMAMVIFAKPGVSGESGNFTIAYMAYANHRTIYDLMDGAIEVGDDTPTSLVKNADGTLTLKKEPLEGNEWDCAKITLEDSLLDCTHLVVTLKGTAGEKVLLKIFDKQEEWVTLTGDVQQVMVPITATFEKGKYSLVLFANAGENGTGHEVTIYSAMYVTLFDETEPQPQVLGDVDLMTAPMNPLEDTLKAETSLVVTKNEGVPEEWTCVVAELDKPDYEGLTKVVVTVKGTAGEKILFKLNDQGAGELWVECTGETQDAEFDIPATFEFDTSKFTMVVFGNAGAVGTGHPFVITRLALTGEDKEINLLAASWKALDADKYVLEKKLVISKATTGGDWAAILVELTGDFSEYYGIKYAVKGAAGQKLLLKVNDQGSGETWLECTGELQTGIITKFPDSYDASKSVLVLFPDAGVVGTGNPIDIYELTLLLEAPAE